MAKNIPVVSHAILDDPCYTGPRIRLDTPEWFAWLDAPTTVRFSYALHNRAEGYIDGFITVRKEKRQRGGAYWSVYRRRGRQLRKAYVGPSTALTFNRLEEIADDLRLHHQREPPVP